MRTRAAWASRRISRSMAARGTRVTVVWTTTTGGTTDSATRGILGGTRTQLSGVVYAFGFVEPPRSVARTFQEIQTGDLILDLGPTPQISLFPGQMQSGVVNLATLLGQKQSTQFIWGGAAYAQAKVGSELAAAWDAIMSGIPMAETILLRRAT